MLKGQIALVTGASRGVGRGIALQLGEAGATVYITGRPPKASDSKDGSVPGLPTLEATAKEVTERGGKGIACYCDHGNPDEVAALFDRIGKETNNQLDILVNNAYAAGNALTYTFGKSFWELEPRYWDDVNNVGLRNHYVCAVFAARIMVPRKKGLIVMVSSAGGLQYLFTVAYGVGKAAMDRMAVDMATELKCHNVCCLSLWPGAVRTELSEKVLNNLATQPEQTMNNANRPISVAEMTEIVGKGETIEYAGKSVVALAADRKKMKKTGRVLVTSDLGDEYHFVDIDGKKPPNIRSLKLALQYFQWKRLSECIPEGIKIPKAMLTLTSGKF